MSCSGAGKESDAGSRIEPFFQLAHQPRSSGNGGDIAAGVSRAALSTDGGAFDVLGPGVGRGWLVPELGQRGDRQPIAVWAAGFARQHRRVLPGADTSADLDDSLFGDV